MHVLTQAELLLTNEESSIAIRRLSCSNCRVSSAMTALECKALTACRLPGVTWFSRLRTAAVSPRSPLAKEVLEAWYQETRDLSLILSRKIGVHVTTRLARAHRADSQARLKADLETLSKDSAILSAWDIKDAAASLDCCVDLKTKTVAASMRLRAPSDRVKATARLNWLLRQLQSVTPEDLFIRLHWTGPGTFTQHSLHALRENPDAVSQDRPNAQLHTLEICLVRNFGGRFGQRRNFIVDVETLVPEFYERAGQRLKPWLPSAPKIKESATTIEEIGVEVEDEALAHASPASE